VIAYFLWLTNLVEMLVKEGLYEKVNTAKDVEMKKEH
jgi:hypothetical protein